MPLITKPNYNQVFATQAPPEDLPAEFNNYPRGWDESRSNNGKPTIKQFNFLQQTSDLKTLWILQNGACLPYDENIEYADKSIVLRDGVIQQLNGTTWSIYDPSNPYTLNYYKAGVQYPANARISLASGEMVRSRIDNNTSDPNIDLVNWIKENLASNIFENDGTSLQEANEFLRSQVQYDNYGIAAQEPLKVYVSRLPIQSILKTDGTDVSADFLAYVAAAKSLGKDMMLPRGVILISQEVTVDFTFNLLGSGRDATIIRFNNTTVGKTVFSFKRGATKCYFKDFTIQERVLHKSTAIKFSDSRTDVGSPVWKCRFDNIEILGFNIANHYTSGNPLSGADHAHCSENLFVNCKFSGNKTWILNQNSQAVNNMYMKCEVENSDTGYLDGQTLIDNNLEFLRDEAGGGFVIVGGSYIGRGRLCGWLYPTGGVNLFGGSGTLTITGGARAECRTTHYGCLFEEIQGGNTANSKFYEIFVTDFRAVVYAANIDLMRFAGRVGATFRNVSTVSSSGRLYIRHYPTTGQSATEGTGSLGSVSADGCSSVEYVKETSSPYGLYNANYTVPVTIKGSRSNSPNASFTLDSKNWANLFYSGDATQLPYQYGVIEGPSRLVYNRDWTGSGLPANSLLRVALPKYGRPMKLFCYKNPTANITTDHTFTLHIVKDNANWADPNNFNLATDAVLVSTTPSSANNAGYFEAPIRLNSTLFGSQFQSGVGNWLEGRMLITLNGSTSFSGFVGVEYT